MTKICVFCGSSMGNNPVYQEAAREVAEYFVANDFSLVYGGANVGLMKILADIMMENHKEVIGIMPQSLVDKEVAHDNITELIVVDTMAKRKQKMVELSDYFIALPGGFGTLDELSEVMTLNQLRICDKPVGILNINGYFDKLLDFIDHSVEAGFVRPEYRRNLMFSSSVSELVEKLQQYQPLSMTKWISDIKTESN
ncbi:MAG: TIGR00730 family Rossman fold protein [Bacteroidales bacterium]|nr:TIGR00730 family Rossman fold protein [Bacteroidales bacterium]